MNWRVSWHWFRYDPEDLKCWAALLGVSHFRLGYSRSIIVHFLVGFLSIQWNRFPVENT